jgi:hypothetical protein
MNQDQINITGMHSTTASYMAKNQTLWTGVNAVTVTVGALNANNAVIAQKRDAQETATDGEAENARQARHDLEEKILEIADQIYALAAKTGDTLLEAQSYFTLSQLDGMDPEKFDQTARDVSALATANLAALADYNITQAEVKALDDLRTNFSSVKAAVPTAAARRAGETKTLPQAIKDNQTLLRKQLDKQMTKFKKTQPEFYAGYQTARAIVNRRSHHASPQPAPAPTPATTPKK